MSVSILVGWNFYRSVSAWDVIEEIDMIIKKYKSCFIVDLITLYFIQIFVNISAEATKTFSAEISRNRKLQA